MTRPENFYTPPLMREGAGLLAAIDALHKNKILEQVALGEWAALSVVDADEIQEQIKQLHKDREVDASVASSTIESAHEEIKATHDVLVETRQALVDVYNMLGKKSRRRGDVRLVEIEARFIAPMVGLS